MFRVFTSAISLLLGKGNALLKAQNKKKTRGSQKFVAKSSVCDPVLLTVVR